MEINNLTSEDIEKMDYNQLIGLTKETNRIPGGRNTVFEIVNRTCIDRKSKVLEIGTSTGFTAIELSKLIPCDLTSIDINEMSLKEAAKRASVEELDNISFKKADVNSLPFENGTFDLVIIGNVLSLMSNREKAFEECRRVCKKTGFIVAVPMYYTEVPSAKLVSDVSRAIKVDITPLYKDDWEKFFDLPGLEKYLESNFKFDYIEDSVVNSFVESILGRRHLKNLRPETMKKLKENYKDYMFLFRENLSKMAYTVLLLSNEMVWEDLELYTSKKINL